MGWVARAQARTRTELELTGVAVLEPLDVGDLTDLLERLLERVVVNVELVKGEEVGLGEDGGKMEATGWYMVPVAVGW